MEYTKTFNKFKSLLSSEEYEIQIPDSEIKMFNVGFGSEIPQDEFMNKSDKLIPENCSFSYPVFSPGTGQSNRVILLFHGLNERSWLKYLTWAYYLADQTDSYVVLFPISFHINRSPASWKDPREMINLLKVRNSSLGEISMSSFANIALSNRLTEDPMRFFKSGYQTVTDIIKLVSDIRKGDHPLIPATSNINIFAYSIGAFLAEIIMMGNPENLFSESKLFIFCGGSVFSNMKGDSKLIMDKRAFDRVYNFYLNDFEKTITGKSPLSEFLNSNPVGVAFRSMIDLGRFRAFRENTLRKLKEQIHTVTLSQDMIIPAGGVLSTLSKFCDKNSLKVWDFPFGYSHENPFPVLNSPLSGKVDYWFEKVFAEAVLFLA
ncbi:MAG: hypothetical protein IPJ37_02705 [Bacteroidales bacterium]|nr:hypothetical protein [Bacteroidales bacterium]